MTNVMTNNIRSLIKIYLITQIVNAVLSSLDCELK